MLKTTLSARVINDCLDNLMRVAVLADTHIPKKAKDIPDKAYKLLEVSDAIVHAGDVISERFLDRLREIAPVYAVLGNNDVGLNLPEKLELDLGGVRVCIIHDSGARKGRESRLAKWFPQANIVIFGHSHIPINETHNGMMLFNPGSPTDKRMQEKPTMGVLLLNNGTVDARIVELS